MLHFFLGPTLAGEPLRSDTGSDFWAMTIRIVLFLVFLLVFVFVCGVAWRTLPGLKAILPSAPQRRLRIQEQVSLADSFAPAEPPPAVADVPVVPRSLITRAETVPEAVYTGYRDTLQAAIADGRPGSVVQAAGEPDNQPSPPIIIMRMVEDEEV